MELADTSAWSWSRRSHVRKDFDNLVSAVEIATCAMVKLELLHSARNADEFFELADDLEALPQCPVGPDEWARALWVYGELAKQGGAHQRSVKHPDLLVAAAAESAGIPVVHYDEDFERIANITGQEHRWLAEPGSL